MGINFQWRLSWGTSSCSDKPRRSRRGCRRPSRRSRRWRRCRGRSRWRVCPGHSRPLDTWEMKNSCVSNSMLTYGQQPLSPQSKAGTQASTLVVLYTTSVLTPNVICPALTSALTSFPTIFLMECDFLTPPSVRIVSRNRTLFWQETAAIFSQAHSDVPQMLPVHTSQQTCRSSASQSLIGYLD